MKTEHQYVAFNDAQASQLDTLTNLPASALIKNTCDELGVEHYFIPQNIHHYTQPGTDRHMDCMNWAMQNYPNVDKYDFVWICDSDFFLLDHIDVKEFMQGYDFAAMPIFCKDFKYYRPQIMIYRSKLNKEFSKISMNPYITPGYHTDGCGRLGVFFKEHPEIRIREVRTSYCKHTGTYDLTHECSVNTITERKAEQARLRSIGCHNLIYSEGKTREEHEEFTKKCTISKELHKFVMDMYELSKDVHSTNSTMGQWDWRGGMLEDEMFYHYSEGSNWDKKPANYHVLRSKILDDLINAKISADMNVFIIPSYIYSEEHIVSLKQCIESIRQFHKEPIHILYDYKSTYNLGEKLALFSDIIIVKCDSNTTADMYTYSYLLKTTAVTKALVMQDSMRLLSAVNFSKIINVTLLWEATNHRIQWNIIKEPVTEYNKKHGIISHLDLLRHYSSNIHHEEFKKFYLQMLDDMDRWVVSIGATSFVTLDFLREVERKTGVCTLMQSFRSNRQRRIAESMFPIACQYITKTMLQAYDGLYFDGVSPAKEKGTYFQKLSFNRGNAVVNFGSHMPPDYYQVNIIDKFFPPVLGNSSVPIYQRNPEVIGRLSLNHIEVMEFFVRLLKPCSFIELGFQHGETGVKLIDLVNGPYIAVDIKKQNNVSYFEHNYPQFRFFHMTTTEYIINHLEGEFDMAFIDASHKFTDSYNDFLLLSKHITNDGIIFLHDTYPYSSYWAQERLCGDSYRTAQKIREKHSNEFEIFTIPVNPGLSIVRKVNKQVAWL